MEEKEKERAKGGTKKEQLPLSKMKTLYQYS